MPTRYKGVSPVIGHDLLKLVRSRTVHSVEVGFVDLLGRLRGVRLPATGLAQAMEQGLPVPADLLTLPRGAHVADRRGLPEHTVCLRPDLPTSRLLPWAEGTAFLFGNLTDAAGRAHALCTRSALHRIAEAAGAAGYTAIGAAEQEFYLLDPATRRPQYSGIQNYSIYRGALIEPVMVQLRNLLRQAGVPIAGSNTEYGPAQVEVNIEHAEVLEAADRVIFLRAAARALAARHGYIVTFMAKPWAEESGNGFHIHQSLWTRAGENAFYDPVTGALSETGRHYLAGLLRRIGEFTAFGSHTPNAYKRRSDLSFCPTNICWGGDNRTVAVRVIEEGPGATRIEQRDAAADCNPYLAFGAQLAAGLEGIRAGWQPPPRAEGNAYDGRFGYEPLPASLEAALAALAAGEAAEPAFGPELVSAYRQLLTAEGEAYRLSVSDWERERYLSED